MADVLESSIWEPNNNAYNLTLAPTKLALVGYILQNIETKEICDESQLLGKATVSTFLDSISTKNLQENIGSSLLRLYHILTRGNFLQRYQLLIKCLELFDLKEKP